MAKTTNGKGSSHGPHSKCQTTSQKDTAQGEMRLQAMAAFEKMRQRVFPSWNLQAMHEVMCLVDPRHRPAGILVLVLPDLGFLELTYDGQGNMGVDLTHATFKAPVEELLLTLQELHGRQISLGGAE